MDKLGVKKDPGLFWPILLHFEVSPGFKNSLRIGEAQIGGSHPDGPNLLWGGAWRPFGLDAEFALLPRAAPLADRYCAFGAAPDTWQPGPALADMLNRQILVLT